MKRHKLPKWKSLIYENLPVDRATLNLQSSLFNGQVFTWTKDDAAQEYRGTIKSTYVSLRYSKEGMIEFTGYPDAMNNIEALLVDYFNLEFNYKEAFKAETTNANEFMVAYKRAEGMRVIRQDPWECLIGFIISQNNNIKRISSIMNKLKTEYGKLVYDAGTRSFHAFPELETLLGLEEDDFRAIGCGYRAKYLYSSIRRIHEKGGAPYLLKLRTQPREHVIKELTGLHGIGMKVADCIALFSLDQFESVPIDTHMLQIYYRVFEKSNTKRNYDYIANFYRKQLGKYAGIKHSFMFTLELRDFKYLEENKEDVVAKKTKKVNKKS